MIMEEFTILISVSADEALQQIQTVSEQLRAMTAEQEKETKKAFNTEPVTDFGKVAGTVWSNFGDAAKDASGTIVGELQKAKKKAFLS